MLDLKQVTKATSKLMLPGTPMSLGYGIYQIIMDVSPKIAAHWLEHYNKNNRPVRPRYVAQLASEIEKGEFFLTHQGIAFTDEIILGDGQHRLHAICLAGRTVRMLVTLGVSTTGIAAVDTGRNRQAIDVAYYMGVKGVTTNTASAARVLIEPTTRRKGITPRQVVAWYVAHKDAIDFAASFVNRVDTKGLRFASVTAAIAAAWYHVPHDVLSDFAEQYAVHKEGAAKSAASLVRERVLMLNEAKMLTHSDMRWPVYAMAERAILMHVNGEEVNLKKIDLTKAEIEGKGQRIFNIPTT